MKQGHDNHGNADGDSDSGIAERYVRRDATHEKQQKRAHTDLIHGFLRQALVSCLTSMNGLPLTFMGPDERPRIATTADTLRHRLTPWAGEF